MPDTELRIMVGMAQGADLLVAQLALERGIAVDAVLPMPFAEYARDFDEKSLEVLRALLRQPNVQCTELAPPAYASGSGGAARDSLYTQLTECLINKSNVLLALWDGESSRLPGGTADTVLRYLSARTDAGGSERGIEFVDAGADPVWGPQFVYWVPTPRSDTLASLHQEPCYLSGLGESLLSRHAGMPPELAHQLAELNGYNREFALLLERGSITAPDSLMAALPADLPAADRRWLERIDAEYGKADALAVFYQRHSDRLFRWFSYLGFSMALLFLAYTKLVASSVLLSMYLLMLVAGLALFYWVKERHWFAKHLIYRVLAETMRARFFLLLGGVNRLVSAGELINLTGISQFAGFSWIGNVLKNVEPLDLEQPASAASAGQRLDCVHGTWIEGQQAYFRSRIRKLERTHHRLERLKTRLLFAVVAAALFLVLFAQRSHTTIVGSVSVKDLLLFLMALSVVWLGIWELYQNKMATRELLWQYRNQLSHFSRAQLQLARATASNMRSSILAELGKESLMESYLWSIHRYHREHEPPTAG